MFLACWLRTLGLSPAWVVGFTRAFLKLFHIVCVEVLWPSQPNRVMLSVVSLPNHTFSRAGLYSLQSSKLVLLHILTTALLESAEGTE